MSGLPAKCTVCGFLFSETRLVGVGSGGSAMVGIENVGLSCPRCGGVVRAFDGTYEVTEKGWRRLAEALRPDDATAEDYARLAEVLRSRRDTGSSGNEIADAIERDLPLFRSLASFIREYVKDEVHRFWITTIIAVLAFVLMAYNRIDPPSSDPPSGPPTQVTANVHQDGPTQEQVEEWVRDAVERAQVPAPARNAPCSCGSGVKSKKCCYAPGGPLHR